jgi:pyridoxal phosphate enzyme (YggS family)
MNDISDRLKVVIERIAQEARASGREPLEIGLVAVSKSQPPEKVRVAFEAGQLVFGENRAQELVAKAPLLPSSARWHFIGHLQKNKIRKILPLADLIHAVDSVELAEDINRIASELGLFPRVLLEVNVSGQASKFGFSPDAVRRAAAQLLSLPRVQVEGLMTIAPIVQRSDDARPFFAALRLLRDEVAAEHRTRLPILSMGMSDDFGAAIQEGATLVRIGTAIFGARSKA